MMRRYLRGLLSAGVALTCSWTTLGCSTDSTVGANPAPGNVQDAAGGQPDSAIDHDSGPDGGDTPEAAKPEPVGSVKRRVLYRSPFGNLDETHLNNLLLDGDMELSTGYGQTPWLALSDSGQAALIVETGGVCRSGLRCLVLGGDVNALLGQGVEPEDGMMSFTMWAKVPDGAACDMVSVVLIGGMTMRVGFIGGVKADAPSPNEQGWCSYHATAPKKNESVGVYVQVKGLGKGQRVVVDDAVLQPASPGQGFRSLTKIPHDEQARIAQRLGKLRRLRPLGHVPWVPIKPKGGLPPRPVTSP